MRTRIAVVVIALVVAGCASGAATPGPNDGASLNFDTKATITIDDNGIQPATTNVHTGDAVAVKNTGTKDHGLASDTINTGTMHPNESTVVFFKTAGTIAVRDRADPTHTATIDVQG